MTPNTNQHPSGGNVDGGAGAIAGADDRPCLVYAKDYGHPHTNLVRWAIDSHPDQNTVEHLRQQIDQTRDLLRWKRHSRKLRPQNVQNTIVCHSYRARLAPAAQVTVDVVAYTHQDDAALCVEATLHDRTTNTRYTSIDGKITHETPVSRFFGGTLSGTLPIYRTPGLVTRILDDLGTAYEDARDEINPSLRERLVSETDAGLTALKGRLDYHSWWEVDQTQD